MNVVMLDLARLICRRNLRDAVYCSGCYAYGHVLFYEA